MDSFKKYKLLVSNDSLRISDESTFVSRNVDKLSRFASQLEKIDREIESTPVVTVQNRTKESCSQD